MVIANIYIYDDDDITIISMVIISVFIIVIISIYISICAYILSYFIICIIHTYIYIYILTECSDVLLKVNVEIIENCNFK